MKCKDCGCEHEPPVVSLFDITVCYKALKKRVEELESRATTTEKRVKELEKDITVGVIAHLVEEAERLNLAVEDINNWHSNTLDKYISEFRTLHTTTTKGAEG